MENTLNSRKKKEKYYHRIQKIPVNPVNTSCKNRNMRVLG